MTLTEAERSALWRSLGATADQTDELLAYTQCAFDFAHAPDHFPLPDEPFVSAWERYVAHAAQVGAWPCLRERLVQLRFPIEAGISESDAYRAATRRGVAPPPETPGLALARPDELRLFLADTPVGRVPIVLAAAREDFVALVRAIVHRNEPRPMLDAVGATIIAGYNNWDRVASLRAASDAIDPLAWPALWREIIREPALYQDCFIVLGSGPYSGIAAAELGLAEDEWTQRSIAIRLEHECTHLFTRRALGSMRNHVADELIADYMGIVAATGRFRADWLVRFLGLERYPTYRRGARLEEYRGALALDGESFALLCDAVVRCARNLEAIDPPSSVADKAEMILALAAIGIEGLASDTALDRYRGARR